MHDTTCFESAGKPAVFVASEEFLEAARAQSAALGFEPASVFGPHPIQDRTDEEMHALAEAALAEILENLTQ